MIADALSRRHFMLGSAGIAAAGLAMPAWAKGTSLTHARQGFGELSGEVIDLSIAAHHASVGGRSGHAVAVNGTVPGPLLRLREGQDLRINVTNHLAEDSSIHWHGLLLPFQFDGVPGISFPGSSRARPLPTPSQSARAVPIGGTAIPACRNSLAITARW